MKIALVTLGCKVNQYESGAIAELLRENGHELVPAEEAADCYIVNTCAVTSEAVRKSRQAAARCRRQSPAARVIVCGCAGEYAPDSLLKSADLVLGTCGKYELPELLNERGAAVRPLCERFEDVSRSETERVRAYIKVQDGCDRFCSYCIVPYLRGRSRSRELSAVLAEIDAYAESVAEFVITGIDLSSYGKRGGVPLAALFEELRDIPARIRLGSLEAGAVDGRLLTALKNLRAFCPHFHLSLQSGSAGVLRLMNRHYTPEEFLEKVRLIRSYFPEAGITTDLIAGFPGETEEEHRETAAFARACEFSDIHVFAYSRRDGTAASKLKEVPAEEKRRRSAELLALKAELKGAFIKKNCGAERSFLAEEREGGYTTGYTENYIRGYLPEGAAEPGGTYRCRVEAPFRDGAMLSVISNAEGAEK